MSKIPVDGSAAGKVIETSGSDFMVPARGRAIFTSQPMSMRIAISSRIFRIRRAQTTLLAFSRMVSLDASTTTVSFSTGSLFQ